MPSFEEFKAGQYSPTPEEIKKVREGAADPDEAERKLRERMKNATERKRDQQAEEAVESLEKAAQEHLGEIDFDES